MCSRIKTQLRKRKEFFDIVLKRSLHLFKKNWFCFGTIACIFWIPVLLVNHFFWQNQKLVLKLINASSLKVFQFVDNMTCLALLAYFLLFLAAVIKAADRAGQGEKISAISAYQRADKTLLGYIGMKLLFAVKVLFWSLLFVVPGIVFAVLYNFAGMAFLVDAKKGKDAFIYSKEIIAANIFDYLFCVILIAVYLFFLCYAAIVIFDPFIMFFRPRGHMLIAQSINLIEIGFAAMGGVFFLIFYYFLYEALKKEGKEN